MESGLRLLYFGLDVIYGLRLIFQDLINGKPDKYQNMTWYKPNPIRPENNNQIAYRFGLRVTFLKAKPDSTGYITRRPDQINTLD